MNEQDMTHLAFAGLIVLIIMWGAFINSYDNKPEFTIYKEKCENHYIFEAKITLNENWLFTNNQEITLKDFCNLSGEPVNNTECDVVKKEICKKEKVDFLVTPKKDCVRDCGKGFVDTDNCSVKEGCETLYRGGVLKEKEELTTKWLNKKTECIKICGDYDKSYCVGLGQKEPSNFKEDMWIMDYPKEKYSCDEWKLNNYIIRKDG